MTWDADDAALERHLAKLAQEPIDGKDFHLEVPERGSTPWQVICPEHGKVALTQEQYIAQMSRPDSLWKCTICGVPAPWDDDNYEAHYPAAVVDDDVDEDLGNDYFWDAMDYDSYPHFGPDE